jgi:hypothetical protein
MYIECQGTSSGNNLIVPTNRKLYFVYNNITSGGGAITVKTAAGTGVSVAVGQRVALACNGTNIVYAVNSTGAVYDNGTNVGIGTTSPTSRLTIAGNSSTFALALPNILETATVSATAATGTVTYDLTTQSVGYFTNSATGNWVINFRASSGTTLNAALATGQAITAVLLVTQGSTAYYNTSVQVDGTTTGVTTKWQGAVPAYGNANGIDVYTYSIIKTGSATYTVLASQTQFV